MKEREEKGKEASSRLANKTRQIQVQPSKQPAKRSEELERKPSRRGEGRSKQKVVTTKKTKQNLRIPRRQSERERESVSQEGVEVE